MADFQEQLSELESRNVLVVAGSVDSPEDAAKTIEDKGLTFPVAHGLDAAAFAESHGAYHDAKRGFLHGTGFLLGPDGKVTTALYSTGAIGRLTPAECLLLIDYYEKKDA